MSNFKKFNQLCVKVPKPEVMTGKKPSEFQIRAVILDFDEVIACFYQLQSFPSDSQTEKEIDDYCNKHNITLVKLITRHGLTIPNIIEPVKGYFNVMFDLTV